VAHAARPLLGAGLVLCAAALWGSFGLFARVLYGYGFTPAELTGARVWIGALALLPFVLRRPARLRLPLRELAFFAFYAVAGFSAFAFLFFATVERTTVAVAAALLYTAPAFVVLLARVFLNEPLDRTALTSLLLVLAGVTLVTGALRALLTGVAQVPPAAALFGIASGITYATYTLCSKHALVRHDAVTTIFVVFGISALLFGVVAPPFGAAARALEALPILLALGLVPSLFAFFLFLRGLRELRASTASMLASLEPAMAAVLAAVILGESMEAEQVAGIALIAGAAVLLARRGR
jgi:drug/metabolite transporter, DME family